MSQFHLPYISSSDGDQYYLYHNNTNLPRNAFVAGISPGLLIFKLSTFDARVRQTGFIGLFKHTRVAIDPKIQSLTKMISIVTSLNSLYLESFQGPPEHHLDPGLERGTKCWKFASSQCHWISQLQIPQRVHNCKSHLKCIQFLTRNFTVLSMFGHQWNENW